MFLFVILFESKSVDKSTYLYEERKLQDQICGSTSYQKCANV